MDATTPLDQSYDELSSASARAMADVARAVISAEGVRWLKAEVKSTITDEGRRFVTIRRPENDVDDVKPYPVLSSGFEPGVSDWVNALETPGGLVILGLEQAQGGKTVPGLASGTDLNDTAIKRRHVEAGAIGNVEIGGVDGAKVDTRSLGGDKLKSKTVGDDELKDNIGGNKLQDGSVSGGKLAQNYALSGHNHNNDYEPKATEQNPYVKQNQADNDYAGANHSHGVPAHNHYYYTYTGATWEAAKWTRFKTGGPI